MPAISKDQANLIERLPGLERRFGHIDQYTVTFESYSKDKDYAALDEGLPGNRCQAEHWGVLLKGKLIYRYEDGDDVITAGQAYCARPGHTAWVAAGTELVKFTPTDQLEAREGVSRDNLVKFVD
jgi:hypothetical protein